MTKREKQIYKSGRKNPDGYHKIPIILRIKYNKKIFATCIVILILCLIFNCLLLFNVFTIDDAFTKFGIIRGIERQDSDFTVYYLDVGQSDCSIVICDNKVMMIDTGTKSQDIKIKSVLTALKIKEIDYLVVTHPHDDHMSNASEIMERYNVKNIIMPAISKDNQVNSLTYTNLINSIAKYNVNPMTAKAGYEFTFCSSFVEIISPFEQDKNLNNMSLVVKISYGETSFLFQGDAEDAVENEILYNGIDVSADVIKVGHHGSNTSTGEKYLNKVNPSVAVVSCGPDNTFKHPNKRTIDILEKKNITTYITAYHGNITVTSDGKSINVIYQNKNV